MQPAKFRMVSVVFCAALLAALSATGCAAGPGSKGCATTSGSNISFAPWLMKAYQ